MKIIRSEFQMLHIIEGNNIVVYGAGAVAKAFIHYLRTNNISYNEMNIVVSQEVEEEEIEGISIYPISDIGIDWKQAVVVIAAMEEKKYGMQENAEQYCKNVYLLDDDFCMHLRRLAGDYSYDWTWAQKKNGAVSLATEASVLELKNALIRLTPQTRLRYVVLNILEHCNLNCKGCDHFAPIAEKREIPFETIEKDLERFSEIMEQEVGIIGIMGGEPLLHPQLPQIISAVRKFFPDTRIQVDTNGMLLLKQEEAFWESCRENGAVIVCTKYPIHLDYNAITEKCRENQVEFEYYGDETVEKVLYKIPLDLKGEQDARESFANCFHANHCVTLVEGRVYPCTVAPNTHIFNERYGTNINLCENDYLDIYNEHLTKRRVLEFLSSPIPFCRFCDVAHRSHGHVWERSGEEMAEWVCGCDE